ncbi:MAG: DUF4189 domain-containing protein [Caulobacterales bacterium]|nr:DUF4189 domain-containing protein [Caulobacterales bacterium]MCA0372762.1 DUF4189 domain-containing protein [Pseudomonadota bacterium]
MKLFSKFIFAFTIFTGFSAMAEGGCPAGMRPIYGVTGNIVNCVEFYDTNQGQGQTNSPQGYWMDSYASLVWGYDKNGGSIYSYGVKYKNQIEADNRALSECSSAGNRDCKVVLQFSNGYLVIASDENGALYGASEFEKNVAESKALQNCMSYKVNGCKLVESVNSRAIWVD